MKEKEEKYLNMHVHIKTVWITCKNCLEISDIWKKVQIELFQWVIKKKKKG